MTIIIEAPPYISDYFASEGHQNFVWCAWDGLDIVGWHPAKKGLESAFKGFRIEKLYNSLDRS